MAHFDRQSQNPDPDQYHGTLVLTAVETTSIFETAPTAPHDAETADHCHACGRRYEDAPIRTPFVPGTSGLLDMVLLAKDVLSDLQAALEEGVLP